MRIINLEETFNNNFDCYTNFEDKGNYNDEPAMSKDKFKQVCVALVKQILELATKNTEHHYANKDWVSKQSITDTIKQVE